MKLLIFLGILQITPTNVGTTSSYSQKSQEELSKWVGASFGADCFFKKNANSGHSFENQDVCKSIV